MSTLRVLTALIFVEVTFAFSVEYRVVNGTRADSAEFPFIVSIRGARSGSHICGGTILNSIWILTAGHCVAGVRPEALNIQYGVSRINSNGPNIVNVSKVIIYERYTPSIIIDDIAILKLQEPIKLGPSARAVKLTRMYQLTPENSKATLIGWGLNESGGTIQKDLQKVQINIYSREECSKRHILRIHPTNICAGIEGGGKGQCNGDSGGPLIVKGRQVGISSWSMKPCTIPPYPGVYTEVSNYIDWMRWVMIDEVWDKKESKRY